MKNNRNIIDKNSRGVQNLQNLTDKIFGLKTLVLSGLDIFISCYNKLGTIVAL